MFDRNTPKAHQLNSQLNPQHAFLRGGGELRELISTKVWSGTDLGPIESWPQSLRTTVGTILGNKIGMYVAWGKNFTQIYNDAYRPILGTTKHPQALGGSAAETFEESWHIIGPLFEKVMAGETVGQEDWHLPLNRHGHLEDCYFTYSYSPILEDSGSVAGVLVTVIETTERVLFEKDRARLETEAENSRNKFSNLFLRAPAAIAIIRLVDDELVYEFANPKSEILAGRRDLVGRKLSEVFPELESENPDLYRSLYDVAKYGKTFTANEMSIRLDWDQTGELTEKFLNLVYEPVLNNEGKPDGLATFAFDVTEQVTARRAVESSEARFRQLANAIPQLAWIANPDGWITWYNQRWFDYTGTNLKEMQGWGWEKVHHPDHRDHVVEYVKTAWSTPAPYEMEFPLRRHDGEWGWFLTRVVPILDEGGNITRWFGTNTDITEHRETQKALAKATDDALANSRKLDGVVHHLSEGLIFADGAGNIIRMNPEALRIHGFETHEHMLKKLSEYVNLFTLKSESGMDLPLSDWPLSRVIRGEKFSEYEVEVSRSDTNARWIGSYGGTPIHDDSGAMILAVLTVRDITQKKNTELALKRAVFARDEFLSIASHELKTPVTSLKLQLQLTRRNVKPELNLAPTPEKLAKVLDVSTRQVERLTALIEDLLDISRIESGKMSYQFELVDLSALVGEVLERFTDQLNTKTGPFDVTLSAPVTVECDRFRIEQVVTNLITNALKYGMGKTIRVSVSIDVGCARISVQDSGMGIAPENQEKIFDRFERAIGSGNISGLGLGLYITKQIVDAHRGKMKVVSELGAGATFTVELPQSQGDVRV